MPRISIIEDKMILAKNIAKVIASKPTYEVVGIHDNFKSAVTLIPAERPHIVVLDIGLRGSLNGLDCLVRIKHDYPDIDFIVHTGLSEEDLLFKALRLGASGYLQKDGNVWSIVEAIEDLLNGGAPMSMSIARRVLRSFWEVPGNMSAFEDLTKRQLHIAKLISQGLYNAEIADRLGITEGGVRGHLNRIYTKMHLNNRTELALLYQELKRRLGG